jgi:hypothetical protein
LSIAPGTRNFADADLVGRKHSSAKSLHQVFEGAHSVFVKLRPAALAYGTRSQRRDIVAALGHHDLDLSPDFLRNTRDMRFRLLDVNGMAIEDAGWA